ncbi:hypothetical protein [Paractinoplanes globisporus]|uniref:Uncharacterized protein n=1 Tax=Paractinoplanes globisporus TaxID=113565 RepID=A0ABW6WZD9_9ACTN|nr:hypothetical protein [Actinoplanes globisporus]
MAFSRLLDAIADDDPNIDSQLAAAVAQMAMERGIGDRNSSITLMDGASFPSGEPRRARIERVNERRPPARNETLVGTLFEGDFESNTAKLRLPGEGVVTVSFTPDMADEIQEALRSQAGLEGWVELCDAQVGARRIADLRNRLKAFVVVPYSIQVVELWAQMHARLSGHLHRGGTNAAACALSVSPTLPVDRQRI